MLILTEDEFLCHAESYDPDCRQSFENYINDISQKIESETTPIHGHEGYSFAMSSDAVLLLFKNEVVGYYTCGAVCIRSDHQGKGLGTELILFAAVHWYEGPPTAHLDEQMFSKAGYAAHKAAYRLGISRGLIKAL